MDRTEVRALLEQVAAGGVTADAATERLAAGPLTGVTDLGFARVDTHRGLRTGDPEVVYGAGKTAEQTVAIVETLQAGGTSRPALVTRARADTIAAVLQCWPDALVDGGTVVVGELPEPRGQVAIISAGTSDSAVVSEAVLTTRVFGAGVVRIDDVGVAGLHRVLAAREEFAGADCLIVVAGMEGALPQRRRWAHRPAARRGAHQRRLRRQLRWAVCSAGDAELLRPGRGRHQHRQWLRRRRLCRPRRPAECFEMSGMSSR